MSSADPDVDIVVRQMTLLEKKNRERGALRDLPLSTQG